MSSNHLDIDSFEQRIEKLFGQYENRFKLPGGISDNTSNYLHDWLSVKRISDRYKFDFVLPEKSQMDSELLLIEYVRKTFAKLNWLFSLNGLFSDVNHLESVVLAAREYFSHDSLRSIVVDGKKKEQDIFTFLDNAFMIPSFGIRCPYVSNDQGFVVSDKKVERTDFTGKVNNFELMRFLLIEYSPPRVDGKIQDFEGISGLVFSPEIGEPVPLGIRAGFNSNFWDNIIHSVDTCRFNYQSHFNASFLDSIDSGINYLCLYGNYLQKKGTNLQLPKPLAITILMVAEDTLTDPSHYHVVKNTEAWSLKEDCSNKYLVVEGLWGEHLQRLNKPNNSDPEIGFKYLYHLLLSYSYNIGTNLFFNLRFNTKHSDSQSTPLRWANFVAKRQGLDSVYVQDEKNSGLYFPTIKELRTLQQLQSQSGLFLKKLGGIPLFEAFGEGKLRYANTFSIYHKLFCEAAGERKKNYAVNPCEGHPVGISLNRSEIAAELHKLSQESTL